MDEFKGKLEAIENHIVACTEEIEFHEKALRVHRDNLKNLQSEREEIAAKELIKIVFDGMKGLFEILEIDDLDADAKFFEYLHSVFADYNCGQNLLHYVENILFIISARQARDLENSNTEENEVE